MRRFLSLFALCLILICAVGCSKEESNIENKDDDKTLTASTVITADETFINSIVRIDKISDFEYSVVVKNSIPIDRLPEIDDIIVIPQCDVAELGFAGIVREISHNEEIYLTTEIPSLDDISEDFSLTNDDFELEILDIQDEAGNQIDYTLENNDSRARHDFRDLILRFPVEAYSLESDNLEIHGDGYIGFNTFSISLQKEHGTRLVSIFDIEPTVGIDINSTVGIKSGKNFSKRIGQARFYLRATIPPGIPVIIPITFYIYVEFGINGEVSASFSLNPHFDGKYHISSESGEWTCTNQRTSANQSSPWVFSSFDVKGEISAGLRCGIIIGLYSATTGIGLNFIPRYSISSEASLASDDLFKVNPIVTNSIYVDSEAYCVASFFGKELAKATVELPSAKLWEEKMTLFPEITDFDIQKTDKTSGLVSYTRNKHFFLEIFEGSEGISLFKENTENNIADFCATNVREDDESIYKEQHLTNLEKKTTYYVSPFYNVFGRRYYGEYKRLDTDDISYEVRTYKLSIISCDYAKLIPPQTTYTFDVKVDENGDFISFVNDDGTEDNHLSKYWQFQDKRTDNGNRSDILTEGIGINFYIYKILDGEGYGCINLGHTHSNNESGIEVEISYEYEEWYGYNIDGPHRRYYYDHNWRHIEFYMPSTCGTFTPCSGWIYSFDENRLYDKIYNASARLELLN